jgi:hypothetical protein
MALKRVAGTCFFKVDGVQYSLQAGLTIDPLTTTREAMVGLDGVHGIKATPRAPTIAATLTKDESTKLAVLGRIENSTITAECADGTTYVLAEAFQSGDLSFNAGDGTFTVTFTGRSCTEI